MPTSDIKKGPLYVDSTNNRVGIGTASPAQPLHVVGSAVQFQNTQSTYLQVNTSDTHLYTAGAHPLRFGSNSAEVVRVETGGLTFTPATNNLYTVSGTLSYYGTTNNVYLNGASSGGMIMSGNGNRHQYVYLNSVSDSVSITTNTVERLGIDSSGRVTMPYQPFALVDFGGGGYLSMSGTAPFDNIAQSQGNHYNTSTYKFTCPVAGVYMVTAKFITSGASDLGDVALYLNGVRTLRSYTSYRGLGGTFIIKCAANDVLHINIPSLSYYQDVGTGRYSWASYQLMY